MNSTTHTRRARALALEERVLAGIVTERQLKRAKRVCKRMGSVRWLGTVLVELGYVYRARLESAMAAAGLRAPFAEFLMEAGYVAEEAWAALKLPIETSAGEVAHELVRLELITEPRLQRARGDYLGLPFVEASYEVVDWELFRRLPGRYLREKRVVPLSEDEEAVTVAVADPELIVSDDISNALGKPVRFALATEAWILGAIEAEARRSARTARGDAEELPEDGVPPLTRDLLLAAATRRASDVHIEPLPDRIRIRFRVDGVMLHHTDLPLGLHERLVAQLKVLSECDLADRRHHQDGRFEFEASGGRIFDVRLATYVTVQGEAVVLRLLERIGGCLDLTEIGMTGEVLHVFRDRVLASNSGVVIVTGPTGSGKTTTLYAAIKHLNRDDTKIVTAEDPVEFSLPGVIQCQIAERYGRGFEETLRAVVRHDPDVIVLGEIRDQLSAEIAVQAALTGHKVVSTFHTEDAVGGLLRLLNMDIDAFLVSSTVISIVGQRLVRRLCPVCATLQRPQAEDLALLKLPRDYFGDRELSRPVGCEHCNGSGYRGRLGVYEVLVLGDELRDAVIARAPAHVIRALAQRDGLRTMLDDGILKAIAHTTSLAELHRVVPITVPARPLEELVEVSFSLTSSSTAAKDHQ